MADYMKLSFANIAIGCFILTFVSFVVSAAAADESSESGRWIWSLAKITRRITVPVLILSCMLATFMPPSKTIAMMYVIPEIANSAVIKQDVPEIYNLAVDALKDQLKTYIAPLAVEKNKQ